MPAANTLAEIAPVGDRRRAAALLRHPLRARIVALAGEPASATAIAGRLGLPRQHVNYHVRRLAAAGFLRKAGRFRKRNLFEQRYVATARAYVVAPAALGPLAAQPSDAADAFSASRLVALTGEAQGHVLDAIAGAAAAGKRLATLSMCVDVRFERAEQRVAFTAALESAITDIVGRLASPSRRADGRPAPGRRYRLLVGCYPLPQEVGGR